MLPEKEVPMSRTPRPARTKKVTSGAARARTEATPRCPATADAAQAAPPPGLDEARHATEQRAARQANVLRELVFPASMATALKLDSLLGPAGYKFFCDRLLQDAGNPTDPIEIMMLQQLALAHFRIGQLHASAGDARSVEEAKIFNAAAARMLGEFRRTALALQVYRARVRDESPSAAQAKLYRLAQ
jgi:hypothetical protein